MLFATDLDRTVIHASRFLKAGLDATCVEYLDGREISYMTEKAQSLVETVKRTEGLYLVPVTTRSRKQFERVQPFQDCPYAIVANGGIILKNGQPLTAWQDKMSRLRQNLHAEYEGILQSLEQLKPYLTKEPVLVDDLFYFTKVVEDREVVERDLWPLLEELVAGRDWTFTIQGIKLYLLPSEVSKENALAYLVQELNQTSVITSGDGKLDAGFLALGNPAFIPERSEVLDYIAPGFSYQSVSQGLRGAEEILEAVLHEKEIESSK